MKRPVENLDWKVEKNIYKGVLSSLESLGLLVILPESPSAGAPLRIVVRPQWLTQLIASIVTFRYNFVQDGILQNSSLQFIWKDQSQFPLFLHEQMYLLLMQCDVLLPLSPAPISQVVKSGQSLVPCLLPDSIQVTEKQRAWMQFRGAAEWQRSFQMSMRGKRGQMLPPSIMPRVLLRVSGLPTP